jgi:hypothetical protein
MKPITNMIVSCTGDAHPTGFRQTLKSGSNVHTVAVNVIRFYDDIAEIDAKAEHDASIFREISGAVDHLALDFDCAPYRVNDAGKLHERTVASIFDDPPVMVPNLWLEQVPSECVQARMCALLIELHEARIADDVRDDDRHEFALNPRLHHGCPSCAARQYITDNSFLGLPRRPVGVKTRLSMLRHRCRLHAKIRPSSYRFSGFFDFSSFLCARKQ